MNKCYIGKIVSKHGIKGELKILNETNNKEFIYKKGNKIIIAEKEYVISTYRHHKDYELVSLEGYEDINLIFGFLNKLVYIDKDKYVELNDKYLYSELVDCDVIEEESLGKVIDIKKGVSCDYLVVLNEKEFLIPIIKEYIISVDILNKKIYTSKAKELFF